jgi:type IV pilus assembly protein PilV
VQFDPNMDMHKIFPRLGRHRRHTGFTLVEVLVAVLVLAVGLIGLAGLQLASMKSNHSAYRRSQAAIAVYDLLDRIRAEPASFAAIDQPLTYEETSCRDKDTGVAAFEDWKCLIDLIGLPSPAGTEVPPRGLLDCSVGHACGSGHCEIAISWDDSRGERTQAGETTNRASITTFRVCSRVAGTL